jgi:membrane fusion protein (multidrug efflux system)
MAFYRATLPIVCLLLAACGSSDKTPAPAPLIVGVVQAQQTDVPLTIEMVGTTRGAQDIPLRARVEGFLESMNFVEGRFVEKGDLLYTIDARPFQQRLVEATSGLAAATTALTKARNDLARIRPLAEMDAVSQRDLDSAVAEDEAASANVAAATAAVRLAEIDMSYTRITAPISGLIGLSKAKPGEFVGRDPNPVVLNTLSDINPIHVRFSISEREFLTLSRDYLEEHGKTRESRDKPSTIDLQLFLADGVEHDHLGRMIASAQTIDPETGTYTLEAAFPNPDGLLLPGQFARVRAPYQTLEGVVVVPRRAIVELQGLYRVYVVSADNKVQVREVDLGPLKGKNQVIESGLDAGESVVVEGIQKVRDGVTVAPRPFQDAQALSPLQET